MAKLKNLRKSLSFTSLCLLGCTSLLKGATLSTSITPVTTSEGGAPLLINLNATLGPVNDVTNELRLTVQDLNFSSNLNGQSQGSASIASISSFQAQRFEVGDSVGPTLSFSDEFLALGLDVVGVGSANEWGGGLTGYLGIEFEIAGATHYGFARVIWSPDNDSLATTSFVTVDQVGYNTVANAPAIIPIPEPSSVMLLFGVGIASLVRRRR